MDIPTPRANPARAWRTVSPAWPKIMPSPAQPRFRSLLFGAIIVAGGGCAMSEVKPGGDQVAAAEPGLHTCPRSRGALVVVEGDKLALQQQGLPSVEPLISVLAQKSNCFRVAKRDKAFQEVADRERGLRRGPTAGTVAADYALMTTVLFAEKTGGQNWGSVIGGIGGAQGAKLFPKWNGLVNQNVDSAVEVNEATVVLSLVDNGSGLEVGAAEGSASARDTRLDGAASAFWKQNTGTGKANVYAKTPQGRLVAAALADGFNKLVAGLDTQASY
ncbi:MAG: hypothetical protein JNM75_11415 [Rhodospirillales bacterium]|nr:hypothetical protein [Rhodospirillales bacterium]